eukprot:gnl/TRDRNA2_/TRDRNA2_154859_c0_seq3.p2 gnl/TRDRNA2_/TRDRNA2_154859_c0~~gnl/TRDRNA2_/TRDRNA2_154859_c0_seq3.p2  ORF type:complete len:117 (+),score=15.72 gnl/TRDRNA2_/TRDRNA2_154859_c0_seq3:48-398(+)
MLVTVLDLRRVISRHISSKLQCEPLPPFTTVTLRRPYVHAVQRAWCQYRRHLLVPHAFRQQQLARPWLRDLQQQELQRPRRCNVGSFALPSDLQAAHARANILLERELFGSDEEDE